MKFPTYGRRGILAGFALFLTGLFFYRTAKSDGGTPEATEGPFYPEPSMRRADIDNDLVKIIGRVHDAGGEIISLKGRITGKDGRALAGHRIEIWQCDVNGKYLHPGDDRAITHDVGFQGFGHDITDADGHYSFRTIKPVKYPGRTPHIHVKVFDEERELLTTQFYLKDHPDNARDGIYRRMSDKQAATVSMELVNGLNGPEATVNLVV